MPASVVSCFLHEDAPAVGGDELGKVFVHASQGNGVHVTGP
jgi:hypothetical protein